MMKTTWVVIFACTLAACGDDAHHHGGSDADAATSAEVDDGTGGRPDLGSGDGTATGDALVVVEDLTGGVRRARITASDAELWVQVGLEAGALVSEASGWDLAFQRIDVRSARRVAAQDIRFEDATQAPADGWVEDGDTLAFDAVGPWWDYDATNHTVSPKAKTFFVEVDAETYFKVAVRDYYDEAGTSGVFTVDYAAVAPPPAAVLPADALVRDGQGLALAEGASARLVDAP